MQRGEWAHRFVHSVAQAGGKLRSADLEAYCADWTSPVRADYRGCQVIAPGLPALGGVNTVEAVRLLDRLAVSRGLHSTSSADALFWLIQTTRALWLGPPLPPERRLDPRTTDVLWQEMQRSGGLTYAGHTRMRKALSHSDAVVAVDEHGNVAALCHSINTLAWGTTGLFVDGVSIPDSASFQQQEIARAGRGNRLPDAMNPVVVTRSGKPVFTSASIGSSLHEITIQGLVNVLDLEMPAGAAACAPNFWMPLPTPVDAALDGSNRFFVAACVRVGRPRWVLNPPQAVEPTGFNKELLEAVSARGLQLVEGDHAALLGHWVAIQQTAPGSPGRLEGAATTRGAATDAEVRGY
jgi:gamma-glutamyltranspeptidase/glutathione hydrolase